MEVQVNRMRYRLLSGGGAKLRNHVVMLVILLVLSWVLLCYLISREKLRLIRREKRITDLARQVRMLEKAAARMHRGIEEQVSAIGELTRETVPSRLRLRIQALQKSLHQLAAPRFKHRPETSHLDCARLIAGDRRYIANVAASRVVMMPSDNLEMNCEAIRWRVLPRVRQPTLNYGIAFARIVHTDYEFLEEQLQVNYSPENTYCYHIDSKSLTSFKNQIIKLSSCLPNVFTTDEEIAVDGRTGRNMNYAHLACLRLLEDKGRWKYVVLQQTHDVVIRTNEELKRIFQALNGSNDVQITPSPPSLYNHHTKWDADALRVFEDVVDGPPTGTRNVSLFITKGAVQTSLSREAVEWINRVNLDKLVDQFNSGIECVDEMLISTLQAAENWAMPGHFTSECARREVPYNGITRMVKWSFDASECNSGFLRHNVCVLGVEDLASISKLDNILVNKIMPSFDYGAIACVSELLFNRTYLAQNDAPLNMTYFENLPAVRYHNDLNKTSFQLQCNYDWRTI